MPDPGRSTLRRTVEQRAKGRCEYCQSPAKYSTQRFSLEHIIQQDLDNLRRKDSLRGAETAEISVRLGNYSASHFEGSAIPRSQGATTSLDNIALACQGCNNHKYN